VKTPNKEAPLINIQMKSDFMWVLSGQVLVAITGLVSIRLFTEFLPMAEYGHYVLAIGFAALVQSILVTPWLQATLRYYPELSRTSGVDMLRKAILSVIVPLLAVASGIVAIIGWYGGGYLELVPAVGMLVAAIFCIDAFLAFEVSLLNAARRQALMSILLASNAMIRVLGSILFMILFGANLQYILLGNVVGGLMMAVSVPWFANKKAVEPTSKTGSLLEDIPHQEISNRLRSYALPLVPMALFAWFNGAGDRYVIASYLGARDVGLYAAIYGLTMRPFQMVGGIIELLLRPMLNDAVADADREKTRKIEIFWFLAICGIGCVGVLLFLGLKELVVYVLLAENYQVGVNLVPPIALGIMFYTLATVFTRFCYVYLDTKAVFYIEVLSLIANVGVLLVFMLYWGLSGAAYAVPCYFGFQLFVSWWFSMRSRRRFIDSRDRAPDSASSR